MKPGDVLPQLYAMRLLLDGVIGKFEQEDPRLEAVDGTCPHPSARQVDATVLGGPPQVVCLVCGESRLGTVE